MVSRYETGDLLWALLFELLAGYKEMRLILMKQFIKFGLVGVSNTVVSYVLYAAVLLMFELTHVRFSFDYLVAQIASFILSVLWSFYWNNRFVFTLQEGEDRAIGKALLKTYLVYSITGVFLSGILLVIWIQIVGISEYLAPLLNLVVTVPLNFLLNKYWAFAKDA